MTFELVERAEGWIQDWGWYDGLLGRYWIHSLITLTIFGLFDKVRNDICEDSVFDVTYITSLQM